MNIRRIIRAMFLTHLLVFVIHCNVVQTKNLAAYLNECDIRDANSSSLASLADDNIETFKINAHQEKNINATNKNGVNLLVCSIYYDNKEAFKYLLDLRADPNISYLNGKSVLHYAALLDDIYYLKMLLKYGAEVDKVDTKKLWKPTPLHYVVTTGNLEAIKVLLDNKANINFRNSMEETTLLVAVSAKNYETAHYLLTNGADYNVADNFGHDIKMHLEFLIIPHDIPLFEDKLKVILFLKDKGIDIRY